MTLVKKPIGRVSQSFGNWSASFINPKTGIAGYGKKFRTIRYGCELESKIENNTYDPITWDGADDFTIDTTHWLLVSGNPQNWLAGQDKPAASEQYPYNGMGRITLKKHTVSGVNTLTQSMMQATNTIYVIRYDFTLGEDITVPANCVLEFDGGSISASGSNDTITGTNTGIQAGLVKIFNTDVTLAGTWNVAEAYPEWFGAKGNGTTNDSISVSMCVNSFPTTVFADKTYCCNIEVNKRISIYGNNTTLKPYNTSYPIITIKSIISSDWRTNIYISNIWFTSKNDNIESVGIQFGDENLERSQYIGRCVFNNCNFKNLDKGIYKPYGNIGNQFNRLSFTNCNYGVYAKGVADMHIGNDSYYDCHFDKCSITGFYANADGKETAGLGLTYFKSCIFEYNKGFDIFIENADRGDSVVAVLDGVGFEATPTENNDIVISGVSYSPCSLGLINVSMIKINNSFLCGVLMRNSHMEGESISFVKSSENIDADSYSSYTIKNAHTTSAFDFNSNRIVESVSSFYDNSCIKMKLPKEYKYKPTINASDSYAISIAKVFDGTSDFIYSGNQEQNIRGTLHKESFGIVTKFHIPANSGPYAPSGGIKLSNRYLVYSFIAKSTVPLSIGVSGIARVIPLTNDYVRYIVIYNNTNLEEIIATALVKAQTTDLDIYIHSINFIGFDNYTDVVEYMNSDIILRSTDDMLDGLTADASMKNFSYFNSHLSTPRPIWFNGTQWVDATGATV